MTRGYKGVTGGFKALQRVRRSEKGLQGVTGDGNGLQGVTGGNKGEKRGNNGKD